MRSRSARTARQLRKIAELKIALIREGYLTLDAQAAALGLGRSTTWNILRATAAVHDYPPRWNAARELLVQRIGSSDTSPVQ